MADPARSDSGQEALPAGLSRFSLDSISECMSSSPDLTYRIERLDPPINAVVTLDIEGARTRADAADARLSRGDVVGPLHGVPLTIKDAFETAGIRTTGGTEVNSDYIPAANAPSVQSLIDAGAIVFGKSNLPRLCVTAGCTGDG